jgi:RimJ/RimL family protein N-acetyltransferase
MNNPFLIGKLIYLRPLEREDAPLAEPWFNDQEVTRTLRTTGPISLHAEQSLIEKLTQNEQAVTLVIVVRELGKAIGVTGLHQIDFRNRQAGFGITIGDKACWGRGYGTEATVLVVQHAFQTLNLNRVWLHAFENNDRGLRTYEKVGFKREGLLRQDNFRLGRYWDTIAMAILRDEWQAPR